MVIIVVKLLTPVSLNLYGYSFFKTRMEPAGVPQLISKTNLKHGRKTKEKLSAQHHSADVGRRVRAELRRIERQLIDARLMPEFD